MLQVITVANKKGINLVDIFIKSGLDLYIINTGNVLLKS